MKTGAKIVLMCPIADESRLIGFVEQCLDADVSILAIYGPNAKALEEKIDWLVVGEGDAPGRFLCTTAHSNETFDDVWSMVASWRSALSDTVEIIRF